MLYPYQRSVYDAVMSGEPIRTMTGRIPSQPEMQFFRPSRCVRIGKTAPVIAFLDVPDYSWLEQRILAAQISKEKFATIMGMDFASGPDKSAEVTMEKLDTGEVVIREIKTQDIVSRNDPLTELP